jgi:hypothetical protein
VTELGAPKGSLVIVDSAGLMPNKIMFERLGKLEGAAAIKLSLGSDECSFNTVPDCRVDAGAMAMVISQPRSVEEEQCLS